MTYANVVAAQAGLVPYEEVMGNLISRRGIAPLSLKKARLAFPVLGKS